MKANRPRFAPFSILILLLLSASCQKAAKHEVLKIDIDCLTHIGVSKSVRLSAYQVYRKTSADSHTVYAAAPDTLREMITPRWSVSDPTVATLSEDGVLTALRPGRITVKGVWENHETEEIIEVVRNLDVGYLPQLSASGTQCKPQSVALSLASDHTLKFHLGFADNNCREVFVETTAPEQQQLPWKFDFEGGTLELTSARGLIVNGEARVGGGPVAFTAWSEGTGTYPISLANKTVLLTGDSMAEGIGWSMRKRVEEAGGRLIVEPWYSSTTTGWKAEGRMKEYIGRYNPDIVFIALGSNEIFTTAQKLHAQAIREINEQIGQRPAYWIGPPSWKPDRGIVRAIEENFRPDHFYNSNDLVVTRRKDGAHPTPEGYETWTGLIWDWYLRLG